MKWQDRIKALPFLAGRAAIVERAAVHDRDLLTNPEALFYRRDIVGKKSWKELLDAGYSALRSVGVEIAKAKTSDEAAAAEMRRASYTRGLDVMENALLQVVVRALSESPVEGAGLAGYAGFGKRALGGEIELIPADHWAAGSMNWERRQLAVNGTITWTGVRIVDLADLALADAEAIVGELSKETTPAHTPTRPHRPKGTSLTAADKPIVDEMQRRILAGEAQSATDAAKAITDRGVKAPGSGSASSKISRLVRRWKMTYGE
jgi:hypothetical protein